MSFNSSVDSSVIGLIFFILILICLIISSTVCKNKNCIEDNLQVVEMMRKYVNKL